MKITPTALKDLLIIDPKVFKDERGYFFESFNQKSFREAGIDFNFVQDNQSMSHKGTLRGLHFQAPPHAQAKLVRVITGSVLDVAVDIRKDQPTYGKHTAIVLSGENFRQLWIPPGFAHGFLTLEDNTVFAYKCTSLYHKDSEDGLLWNDSDLNIDWGTEHIITSEKDKNFKKFRDFVSPF
jgi:dTDP-4-dehydrorhamnose 3,5-epimerase